MRLFRSKKIIKNLIIILSVLAILISTFPSAVKAKTDTEDGGGILEPVEEFVLFLGDKVMQWLQNAFVSPDNIEVEEGVFEFKYSPAIIFSGDVPAFDINFISQGETKTGTETSTGVNFGTKLNLSKAKEVEYKHYTQGSVEKRDDIIEELKANYEYNKDREIPLDLFEGEIAHNLHHTGKATSGEKDTLNVAWHNSDENLIYLIYFVEYKQINSGQNDIEIPIAEVKLYKIATEGKTYESTARVLQNTIATWYNALRRIALVGLLSVLIYVGIRIVMSSASSEKAKYKEMLKDWLVAICLLFTLHYIMSITITVTNEISAIFQPGESDVLLNTLRQEIFYGADNLVVLAKVIMYVVLVILTVTFTIQYLKRVIYMAFYTLIAPLITLTYPLDKIKDGQAQAFNMWIKEYIYTALTQVIHLVIYFVLVGSALDLVADYPLYAIIVLAFMKKADGIIKKMFGFDKAETVGTLGAAATGGLIISAMNKISAKAKGKSGGGSSDSKESGSSSNVRTASQGVGGSGTCLSDAEGNGWKGAGEVAKKYGGKALKGAGKGALKGAAGATGAMAGFAAGVAQGDISAAFKGAVAGGAAGTSLAGAGINTAKNLYQGGKNAINDLVDTWNTGAYGEEYAQGAKQVRDFKGTSDYKALKEKYKDNLTDDKIKTMLQAGIQDKRTMSTVMEMGDMNKGIGYYKLAKACPDNIFYDKEKLKEYVGRFASKEGLNAKDTETIIENMEKFK